MSIPSGSPIRARNAASARSRSSDTAPPAYGPGANRPSTSCASVTRRLLAAAPVGGRPWNRTRPARPREQQSGCVGARDGAAAGPDGMDVHRGGHQIVAADLEPVGDRDPPARAQHDVARGAADLHGDEIVESGRGGEVVERAHSARRSRQHEVHGAVGHLPDRDRPSVRLQHEEVRPETQCTQALVEGVQVAHHLRADAGVDHGGGAPFVLADDRHHRMRERHPFEAAPLAQHLGAAALVGAVLEAVQQADRDRFHRLGAEGVDRGVEIGLVEGLDLGASRVEAPADRQAQIARDQHRRVGWAMVEGVGAKAPPCFQEVAKAAGDQHAHPSPAALQHRVGGHGGAVQKQRAVRKQAFDARPERSRGVLQDVEHPAARVRRHRGRLEDVETTAGVHQHHGR